MLQGIKDIYMYVLGALVVLGAVATNGLLILYPIPNTNHDVVLGGINQLYVLAAMVVGYFYGSSKSSADKTQLLNKSDEAK
jgi:hypothetical protein